MNAFSFLIDAGLRWPTTPAVISANRSVTYKELLDEAQALQAKLLSLGIRPGMGVGLVSNNSVEFLVGLFAGLACEAVVMPISPQLKDQEFSRVLELVPMAAIVHDGALTTTPRFFTRAHHSSFEILIRPEEFHGKVASGVPNAAVIRFTSGTTGSSKGVVLSHSSVLDRTAAAAEALQIQSAMRVLWVLPMAHHFVVSLLTYVRYGATVVLPPDLTPSGILQAANEHAVDLLYASPALLSSLLSDDSERLLPRSIRIISTSTGISRESLLAFEARFELSISQMYGLIEVGLPLGNLDTTKHSPESVGILMPRYEAAILDPQGRPLPAGQVGRLAVKGPGMFDAYLAPYRPRQDVLVNGWFLTGDLGVQGYDGAFSVCGREKSVIHSGGEKVFPEEVEAILNSYPGIRTSRVFGVQKTNLEETIVAEVAPQPHIRLDLEALRSYAGERLSSHKVPAYFVTVSSIALTQTGKVIRAKS